MYLNTSFFFTLLTQTVLTSKEHPGDADVNMSEQSSSWVNFTFPTQSMYIYENAIHIASYNYRINIIALCCICVFC